MSEKNESKIEETKKVETRTERTKKKAGDVTDTIPEKLAVITNHKYENGLGLNQNGEAYLYPLVSADGLKYEDGKLFFAGLPASEAELREINKDKKVSIDKLDLSLLRMFYSIILCDFEKTKKEGQVNENITIYLPNLAAMLGKSRNISKNDIDSIIEKASSFQTVYGIVKSPERPRGIGSALPILVWLGYHEETNTIKFASPYMTELIRRIYNVSVRKSKRGIPQLKKNGEPLLEASHSFSVKSSIVKERNKRAVEIVIVVVKIIECTGKKGVPHISARTIIERVPQLKEALEKKKNVSNQNQLLKRSFSKAWELLETQTTLRAKYPSIVFPDPENPKNIPTMATLDIVFNFPH